MIQQENGKREKNGQVKNIDVMENKYRWPMNEMKNFQPHQ